MPTARLSCHWSTPAPAVHAVTAHIERSHPRALAVSFVIEGDLAHLRIPAPAASRPGDGLWEHTCGEVFLATTGPAYHEVNLSPSGAWAGYAFRGYRDRIGRADELVVPPLAITRGSDRLDIAARLALPPSAASSPLHVGLTAVIESDDGSRSYWALRHPAGRPDFHHRDGFSLVLETPGRG